MTKKLVRDHVWSCITDYTKLVDIKKHVDEMLNLYGEDAEIEFDSGYNNIDERLYFYREETDGEYQNRLKYEAREREESSAKKSKQEEKERKEYERLKAKFG